uniref:Uncharacterized protein n=1 Tax=Anopheles melas TaxID=34690 RepID=A0A182UG54_9DIPT
MTAFLSVSCIFISYSSSGLSMISFRLSQMKMATFSVVLARFLKYGTSLSRLRWSSFFMIAWFMYSFRSVMFITMPVLPSTGPRTVTSTGGAKEEQYLELFWIRNDN